MVATEAVHPDSEDDAWVQVWVQLKKEKWLPISRKRHQIGHLDFRSFRLLTEMLEVRILAGEPTTLSRSELRTFRADLPFHEEMSSARITINRD